MAKILNSMYGKVHRLANNPRQISDGAYTLLVESLSRGNDIEFLMAKRLVVWKVPDELPSEGGRKWPFSGQEGKLVVLGGNQRYLALQELGYDRIPDEWLVEGRHKGGEWWTPDEAERFILLDNNPEGISGETDYVVLVENFNRECMKMVGMDFAQMPLDFQTEDEKKVEDEVEEEEHGEKDEKLKGFIDRREKSRGMLDEILDMGFYCVVLWETHEQKMRFVNHIKEKYGIDANRDIFINGFDLAREATGLDIPYSGLKFPTSKPEKNLQEMAMDGRKDGWETGDSVPDGEEIDDDEAEKVPDGNDMGVEEI